MFKWVKKAVDYPATLSPGTKMVAGSLAGAVLAGGLMWLFNHSTGGAHQIPIDPEQLFDIGGQKVKGSDILAALAPPTPPVVPPTA